MGCGSCSTGGCAPAGCKSNGSCLTNGCSKLDVYDWLADMDLPSAFASFNIVEIKFKGSRKDFYINQEHIYIEQGDLVVVDTATGGYDIGHVSLTGELVRMQIRKKHLKIEDVTRKIYRKASPADVDKWKAAKDMEWETMHRARKLALELGLSMKLSDVDYQGDKTKATFYYTAEGRVDFRELIKRMAETFRIRIEMRQIGMRQEASRLGGIGSCGRELCCSTWLTDFKTVSTAAARYQNLSLNTLKLAGQCGKLKCCLNYELDTYMDALKDIPDHAERLETGRGQAKLQKTDIFKRLMWFSYPGDDTWIPLEITRVKEIQQMNRSGEKPDDLKDSAAEIEAAVKKEPDYENVVGQDSLTRLDDRNRRNNTNKNRNSQRPQNRNQQGSRPDQRTGGAAPDQRNRNQPRKPEQATGGTDTAPSVQPLNTEPGNTGQQTGNGEPGSSNRNRNRNRRFKNNNRPKPGE